LFIPDRRPALNWVGECRNLVVNLPPWHWIHFDLHTKMEIGMD
jgi:hypothetical protein